MHLRGRAAGQSARCSTACCRRPGYADFSGACRDQLARGQARRVRDWRLDYDLRLACKDDVPRVRPQLCVHRYVQEEVDRLRVDVTARYCKNCRYTACASCMLYTICAWSARDNKSKSISSPVQQSELQANTKAQALHSL